MRPPIKLDTKVGKEADHFLPFEVTHAKNVNRLVPKDRPEKSIRILGPDDQSLRSPAMNTPEHHGGSLV